jgi:YD repeat-containing protein
VATICVLVVQPLIPIFEAPVAYADDEFEPWCGNDCEDSDDEDDDDDGCEDGDSQCNNNCSASGGSSINFFTGEEIEATIDLYLPGVLPLVIARTYRSQSLLNNRYGFGWDLSINQRIQRQSDGSIVVNNGFCGRHIYQQEAGGYQSPPGLFVALVELPDGSYELREQDGLANVFDREGKLIAIRDRFDNRISFSYASDGRSPIIGVSRYFRSQERGVIGYDFRLASITDISGRQVTFDYNEDGRLRTITYADDRRIEYEYDENDNLVLVVDERGDRTEYRYEDPDDPNNMTGMTQPWSII